MRVALLAVVGCSGPLPPTPALVRAVDVNPDPDIVEVELVATPALVQLVDGEPTPMLAYRDGSGIARVPGPLIEAKRGDRLIVHFRNELPDRSTTVHWHGLRLPIEMDGDPMVVGAVPPGGSYDYDFTLRDAGLFWYHPHVQTDEQVELGLQGALLVHDRDEPALPDRTFVLDDIDLDADNSIRLAPSADDLMYGRRGDTLLVNGQPPGQLTVAPGAVERWRFANTSNGRFFDLSLGSAMRVIAWDGGVIADPYDVDHLVIAPGERYEVLVELARSTALRTGDTELVRVEVEGAPVIASKPPIAAAIDPLVADGQTRRFVLREDLETAAGAVFYINDERWPFNVPIPVSLGATETWEIVNDNEHEHPFHAHGHFFQVQDAPHLGWKDTVRVPAKSTVRVAVHYEAPGMWMVHCQIPEHAERGMTANLDVMP